MLFRSGEIEAAAREGREPQEVFELTHEKIAEIRDEYEFLDADDRYRLLIDLGMVSSVNYYTGIVFKGYLQDMNSEVLSGGRYDPLMHKMGKKSGAIGFAVYLDLLDLLKKDDASYGVDTLLIYPKDADAADIFAAQQQLSEEGTVFAAADIPEKIQYKKLIYLEEGRLTVREDIC